MVTSLMMELFFITIYPAMFQETLDAGVLGVAARKRAAKYSVVNLRDFAVDKHGSVDDYPYGGGPGMIMMASPVVEAVESITGGQPGEETAVILLSPAGEPFNQKKARRFSVKKRLIFICGRYKGVDERINDLVVTDRVSIGDYVVSGGELPALLVADSVVRYLPGVLGDELSRDTDSFSRPQDDKALDSAYYTRPEEFRGLKVPDVLMSGNHARIDEWRENSARERTSRRKGS